MSPSPSGINHPKWKVTTGRAGVPSPGGPREPIVRSTGAWVSSNLPHLLAPISRACHPASNMEFAAPFGTAKKGKAAQVEEVQPMAADPSSCSL